MASSEDSTKKSRPRRPTPLRSKDWFDNPQQADQTAIYVERYTNYGLTRDELQSGKPIIGIAQSGSDLTPCNRHHMDLAQRVREGIREAGGVALEFPVHPIHEMAKRPTAALDRNLLYLGLVEILYGYPLDGVVLTTGCDKTTPAMIMAAAAVDLPAIVLSGGPMLNGWDNEKRKGSGTVIWECRELLAAGTIDYEEFMRRVCDSAPSAGHCNTMGTALTMNCVAEALGLSLPTCADIPAPYPQRGQMAYSTGKRIVDMVWEDLRPSKVLTKAAFRNAIRAVTAIGGSSNAPIHLQAIARQLPDSDLSIDDWQRYGEQLPMLTNCQPAGDYLGEDFYRAGGLAAVLGELLQAGELEGETLTVSGDTFAECYRTKRTQNKDVIRPFDAPFLEHAGFAVLRGNLFDSAIMKKSVISDDFRTRYLSHPEHPMVFDCRAIVFDGPEHYHRCINDPELAVDADCILVIRHCGPVAYPGSAEVVNMLPPDYLVKQGITTLPCLGDGRQSGTSASPSILNASPEAAAGGNLAILEMGDTIRIDLNNNVVNVLLDEASIAQRRASLRLPKLINQTPWQTIYRETVGQLDSGAVLELDDDHQHIIARQGTPRHSH